MSTPLKARISVPRSKDLEVNGTKYNRASTKRNNFEMYAWLFMRVSGVVLLALVFVHLWVNLVSPEGGVKAVDFAFVAGKWASPFWQVFDLVLLWLAMLHGTNGLRVIIDDYAERDRTRFWLKMLLTVTSAFVILLGTLVIFTFEPCPTGAEAELLASFCQAG
ncbi:MULTISPECIES: succinate dehydrogenase hydrophobic membrane anchor subunit [Kocuria]|jgi:succinate dehydrogenase / fumarate reductase membrane anchor subunit|uniref:succinate dehydrogenase hydrophobic membrane anchor subunit n=1 Tax=Kocuria TaxID=57493 RepID=UPI0020416F56|nr:MULTISPECIES: succinate dehydrogenase hydrophobic membrane anchor subunit [Kocuria]MCM3688331.1 succinate dehydrogenase hydrophobic membrane anchor subunit [Kocuria rosea]HST71804.1 succinate dehydrogenase hydrophobic membrane anchor subunit [Kocuria rosea]